MQERTITADYTGFKFIKARSCFKLEFEVDEMMGSTVMERLGLPSSGESKACLIVAVVNKAN